MIILKEKQFPGSSVKYLYRILPDTYMMEISAIMEILYVQLVEQTILTPSPVPLETFGGLISQPGASQELTFLITSLNT